MSNEDRLARAWAPHRLNAPPIPGPELPGPAPKPKAPKVERIPGATFIDGWCDDCSWRTEYITPAAVALSCAEHAGANPGHTARWRKVQHKAYVVLARDA